MTQPVLVDRRRQIALFGCAILLLLPRAAAAADLRVLCSNGFRAVMNVLVPQFEHATSNRVNVTYGLSAELVRQIRSGEPFDVTILTPALIDELAQQGIVASQSRASLARSAIGVAVRRGAPKPDLHDSDAVRRTMLGASSIAYAKEGASASFFLDLVQRLGLTDALKHKIVASASGAAVAASVASGDIALGVMPVSEILPVAGVEVGGIFPAELSGYITMTAAVSSRASQSGVAAELIRYLTGTSAAAVLQTRGMQAPVTPSTPLPPAYPRAGATMLFENARVQVWNIAWLKQQYPLHRHVYDLAGVYYASGDRSIVSTDGSRRPVTTRAWETAFQKSGVTHIEEGTSDSPLRAVFIEMKEPAARGTESSQPSGFENTGATMRSENERSVIWEFAPAAPSASHRHLRDAVAIAFEAGTPRVVFIPAGTVHEREVQGRAERVFVFELK
jgi:molybdate transport system substrate-binding protein